MNSEPESKAANEGEAMPESKVKLPPILRLPWPEEGSLHPYAYQKYLKFLAEILKEAPGMYLQSPKSQWFDRGGALSTD